MVCIFLYSRKSYLFSMIRRLCFFILLLFAFTNTSAQQFGGFPPSTKWKQINTDTVRVIFTDSAAREAQRVATILHLMAATQNPLGKSLQKINVVLHPNTTEANGYVALGPFRSEYFLIPGGNIFDFGNLHWTDQLAVHEYRHVQQYNNFNKGLSKAAGVILGQEGRALANALSVPDWFFEGDAVYAETVLTLQGRGRMPYFLKGFNSLWKEGRTYDWMKLRNGSLKDFVPNHYPLGYLLVNYGYTKFGADFWRKVTTDAASFKGLLYPFQKAIERHAGIDFKTFRTEALKFYSHEVSKRREDQKRREVVTNIYHPQVIGSDSLIYLKDSYKNLPRFYIRDKNGEHKISLRNITGENWFGHRNGVVAYTAYNTNARWSLTDYSDIILLDVKTGSESKITNKGKYFTPDISPAGDRLIAVSVTPSLQSELHLLNREGEIIKKVAAPDRSFFVQPRFIDDGSIVVAIKRPNSTISLERLDLNTVQFESLIAPSTATIGFPFVHEGTVYFTSSLNGSDDIYSLNLKDKKMLQLTSGGSGHYFPSVQNDTLTWSLFTSNGFQLESKALSELTAIEINPIRLGEQMAPFKVANEEGAVNVLAEPTRFYTVRDYKKTTGLFNFHSWRPLYDAPEYSFSVYSNNILNTFANEIFYRYNEAENSHALGFNASYGGFYPQLNAGIDYTFNRRLRTTMGTLTLNQTEARIGYSIPLNFTEGKTFKFLNFGSNLVYNSITPTGFLKDSFRKSNIPYGHHFIGWSQQLPRARQHIFPKLGYALSGAYRHRLDEKGYQSFGAAQIYLPALATNHSLVLTGSFQQTDTNNIVFSNRFAASRGYNDPYFSRMWKASGNYHLPLLYPDKGVANIVYLLRVRSNVFYDYTKVFSADKFSTAAMRSTGAEVFFDTRWWNQLPVSFGVRWSYLLDNERFGIRDPNVFEFVLPLNLIPD